MYNLTNTVTTAFTYATIQGTITIIDYTGSGVAVIIPSTINGLLSLAWETTHSRNCLNLTSVTVPNSVTNIGNYEFYDCPSLTGVYFQGNVPTTGLYERFQVKQCYRLLFVGHHGLGDRRLTVLWRCCRILRCRPAEPAFRSADEPVWLQHHRQQQLVIVVEASTNLANPVWIPLQTNTLNGSQVYFSDPQWTNYHGRFYRLSSP